MKRSAIGCTLGIWSVLNTEFIVGFQQVKRLVMSRPFILFLWCRQIASEEKGGGDVKYRELLGETYALGHYSFQWDERAEWRGEQSRIPWNCRNMQHTVLYTKSESCLRGDMALFKAQCFTIGSFYRLSELHCGC